MKEYTPADNREDTLKAKYNYVFFKVTQDYAKPFFFPLRKHEFVRVYERAFEGNALLQKLFFLHWSNKINSKVKLPFKRLWFKKICKQDFHNDKPTCYIFNGGKYLREAPKLYDYIKKLNPDNKVAVYMMDLCSEKTINELRPCCDAIVTYDTGEAQKYGIYCFDDIIYGAMGEVTEPEIFDWDVYFLGFAKDRLNRIHRAYRTLTNAGLRCNFIICGTKPEDRIEGEGLHYQNPISYAENLENVKKSRCILELMQGGSDAPTMRTEEAITYKRKLLTDHVSAASQYYFNLSCMRTFAEPEQIDTDFASAPIDYAAFDDRLDLSPDKLITFYEDLWSEQA